jgi:NADPH-dependent 2,4-dienoyl-CoA reductase/sulfur reductase-like enzyme
MRDLTWDRLQEGARHISLFGADEAIARVPHGRQLAAGDRVIVVGAGPAGLTAVYVLAKRGLASITVLEVDGVVDGIARRGRPNGSGR